MTLYACDSPSGLATPKRHPTAGFRFIILRPTRELLAHRRVGAFGLSRIESYIVVWLATREGILMMRTTQQFSITLPHEMAEAVDEKIKSGKYASVSEVVRDGVRALLERDAASSAGCGRKWSRGTGNIWPIPQRPFPPRKSAGALRRAGPGISGSATLCVSSSLREPRARFDQLHAYITDHANEGRADAYMGRIVTFCMGFAAFPQRGQQRHDVLPGLRIVGFASSIMRGFVIARGALRSAKQSSPR